MLSLQTSTMGVMDTPEQQHEYMLVVSMIDCAIRGKGDWMAAVTSWFQPDYMSDPYLRSLYMAAVNLLEQKAPVNPAEMLTRLPAVGAIFGKRAADLYGLFVDSTSQGGNGLYYAQQVYNAHRRSAASEDIHQKGNEIATSRDPDKVLGQLPELQAKYAPAPHNRVIDNRASYDAILEEMEGRRPQVLVRFGINVLDECVKLKPGVLCTVAAPTTCGKSVLLGQTVIECVKAGHTALLFTYEMTHQEMVIRWASYLSRQPYAISDTGRWIGGDRRRWLGGMSDVRQYETDGKLQTFEGGRTVEGIAAAATAYAATNPVGVIVVDYLQLVPPTNTRNVSREQQVSHVANQLKQLASALKVPVVTASQLNDDGLLRESRDIGHASDIVLKMEPEDPVAAATTMKLHVDKNRGGRRMRDLEAYWEKPLFTIREREANEMRNYDHRLATVNESNLPEFMAEQRRLTPGCDEYEYE